jgi:DNA-binding LacI/PurR family transcriptional regulator
LVFVDQDPSPHVSSVNVDDRGGAKLAATHLIDLGHRHIGVVVSTVVGPHGLWQPGEEGEAHVSNERMRGWRDALDPAGIEPVVVNVPHSVEENGYQALSQLFDADPRITGILCFADTLAHGVMLAAQDRGLTLPDDLSVVGFDDNPLAARLRPALTTVRQDVAAKGRRAALELIAAINGIGSTNGGADGKAAEIHHVLLPVELVVRESTAPPRADR